MLEQVIAMSALVVTVAQSIRKAIPTIDGWKVYPLVALVSVGLTLAMQWPLITWQQAVPVAVLTFLGAIGVDLTIAKHIKAMPKVFIGKVTPEDAEATKPDLKV